MTSRHQPVMLPVPAPGQDGHGGLRATDSAGMDGAAAHTPVPSELLLAGRRELQIVHQGVTYRLQATRLGKLILTK